MNAELAYIDDLIAFALVVKTENIDETAACLGLKREEVIRRIHHLESKFGTNLFANTRTSDNRIFVVAPSAKSLYKLSSRIFRAAEQANVLLTLETTAVSDTSRHGTWVNRVSE